FDGTDLARLMMSAVQSLKQRYGTHYVIDILRGSQSARIDAEHKALRVYGGGRDVSRDEWTDVVEDLIATGYLAKTAGIYPVLRLTEKALQWQDNNDRIILSRRKQMTKTPAAVAAHWTNTE